MLNRFEIIDIHSENTANYLLQMAFKLTNELLLQSVLT